MSLIGKRVTWEKLSGKDNSSMTETKGFGSLSRLEIGGRLVISGDYGIYTTEVSSIKEYDSETEVTTKNSVYLLKEF